MNRLSFPMFAAVLAFIFPFVAMVGWVFDYPLLKSILPGFPAMIPLTALTLGHLALGLFGVSRAELSRRNEAVWRGLALAFVLTALTLALVTLLSRALGFEAGIGQVLFSEDLSKETLLYGGNMSHQTAVSALAISLAILLSQLPKPRRSREFVFQILPAVPFALCLLALAGYLQDIRADGPSKFTGLSLPTTLAYFLLSVGTWSLRPHSGIVGRLRGRNADSLFLRWYLPFGIVLPIVLVTIINRGAREQLYPGAFGDALIAVLMSGGLVGLGLLLSVGMRRYERQRFALEKAESRLALQRSEESLAEASARLEFALEASRMGTWDTNLDTGVSVCSSMTSQILGLPPGTVTSPAAFYSVIYAEDRAPFSEARARALRERRGLEIDMRCVRPDGSLRWIRCKGRVKTDAHGEARQLTGTIMDVTEEKLQRQALERARDDAESASRLKSAFLANMSHEIRTPLSAILGFTDLMREMPVSDKERTDYLEIIARNGRTLSSLLNDILDLSKVESGRLDVERVAFPLREAVDEVVTMMAPFAAKRGVPVEVEWDRGLPERVVSDPMRLKQVLTNLVGNALKFTDKGRVRLRVRGAERGLIQFEIEDTGIGIEAAHAGKLFQPFSQADDSVTRKYGGTGLGLALSRKLAMLLGGTVELRRSQPGVGSLFVASIENRA